MDAAKLEATTAIFAYKFANCSASKVGNYIAVVSGVGQSVGQRLICLFPGSFLV